jgi:HSP20 family molecular chaperone IbpA
VAVAFTSISFETPNASMFQFTPPPGTTVENLELPQAVEEANADWEAGALTVDNAKARGETLVDELADGATTAPIGERWDTVITMDQLPADIPVDMFEQEIFQDLFTEVAGGKVFSTPLVNVLLTDDGAVFAGAVTIAHLVSLASR